MKHALLVALALTAGGLSAADAENACDAWLRPMYGKLAYRDYTLVDRAARTIEANAGGRRLNPAYPWAPLRGSVPSDGYFDGIWNWDAAFIAMGAVKWDAEFARDQFRIMAKVQQDDGKFPDVWRYKPEKWAGVFAGCSKPPVWGWAVWTLDKAAPDAQFRAEAYAALVKNAAFWETKRGGAKDGLFHYDGDPDIAEAGEKREAQRKLFAGWETGWDDSPRWDGNAWNVYAIDLNCWMVLTYRSLRDLAEKLGKPEERAVWKDKAEKLSDAIRTRLWDAESACFYDWNFKDSRFSRVLTPASFMPLYIGIATKEQATAMAKAAKRMTPGWPSVSYDDKTYDPMGYWRGRTWINIAYFAIRGLQYEGFADLAAEGREEMLKWMAADPSGIYENYNSQNTLPAGFPHFGWSCTFAIKFVLDWNNSRAEEMPL